MAEVSVKIEGMSCQHCVMRVKKAIDGVDGVNSSEVEIGSARVVFDESKTSEETIKEAITKAGYRVAG
ncbi:MAG: copper chaperone [Nitrospirae bacterium]|nr:MAG: copper chaperone [Nitrospirota bacterium]